VWDVCACGSRGVNRGESVDGARGTVRRKEAVLVFRWGADARAALRTNLFRRSPPLALGGPLSAGNFGRLALGRGIVAESDPGGA